MRAAQYLPDVVEGVIEAQMPARISRVTTAHGRLRIDLSRGSGGL